jgi:DNA-binding transcriptional ArsR family regulator
MRAPGSVGRLSQVCERWIYSACLGFALSLEEQQRSGFRYTFSVFQAEYSRNLLFTRGRVMEEVFDGVIDRTRSLLDIKTVKTIFGYKRRPSARGAAASRARSQAAVETPVYTLTVFKIHFRRLTVRAYSKGGRVLRIEAIAHNTEDLRRGKRLGRFPEIVSALEGMVERFLSVLRCVDASRIEDGTLDALPLPAMVGSTRVGGVEINRPRTRAVVAGVVAASADPRGFTVGQLAARVREVLRAEETAYRPRQASYDLKKLRAKGLVVPVEGTRRYRATPDGLRTLVALYVLREKVLKPLLAGAGRRRSDRKPRNQGAIDAHYENIQVQMQALFQALGLAA